MFLAKLIGLFLLIQGITFFVRASDLKGLSKEFAKSSLFQLFAGTLMAIGGLLIVMVHNVWDSYWQSLISAFGWFMLVKGVLLLWSPELIEEVLERFEHRGVMQVASLTVYTLAIIFLAFGFGVAV